MAERRMFAKSIVMSDAFLDMPATARCLYFTLGMFADDDGFVNSPKSIMRQCGSSMDDINVLIAKKFVYTFEEGVIVIKHWRINNLLRSDRKRATNYKEQLRMLYIDENGAYKKRGIPNDNQVTTNCQPTAGNIGLPSIGKDSIGKDSIGNNTMCIRTEELFDQFWSLYPNKTNKKKAKALFLKLNPDEELFSKIMQAVSKQKESDQWKRGFIPHPTTWLNGERWNDEISEKKNSFRDEIEKLYSEVDQ